MFLLDFIHPTTLEPTYARALYYFELHVNLPYKTAEMC